MKIAIAGASGFVGKALIQDLCTSYEIIGLSRSNHADKNNLEWRACDLFSMLDAERGLKGADLAIYLVHSMRHSAQLTQGSFDDLDLIVADNFVRAAEKAKVKQILFLGGMMPEDNAKMSAHLRSRWEVEQVFLKSKIPVTILRASLILGAEGSSFQIVSRLVRRLPVMLAPSWTNTVSHPVALSDVVKAIRFCLGNVDTYEEIYEIGTETPISYRELMLKLADKFQLRRKILSIPLLTPRLSTLWVCLITRAPKELVRPLIQSLKTSLPMNAESVLKIPDHRYKNIDESLNEALANLKKAKEPVAFQTTPPGRHVVRSVQRLKVPQGLSAEQSALAYLEYLPRLQPGLLKVEVHGKWIYFCWRFPYTRLLVLEYSSERSSLDRQLFYVRGGLMAKKTPRARLEFREVLGGEAVLSAIHDFKPRLPWFIYRWTQALFHLWVMRKFGFFLIRNGVNQYQRPQSLERHP